MVEGSNLWTTREGKQTNISTKNVAMQSLFFISTIVILNLMNIGTCGVNAFATAMKRAQSSSTRIIVPGSGGVSAASSRLMSTSSNSTSTTSSTTATSTSQLPPPLYIAEGLLAVHKPLTWTSNDVVSYIRGILVRDAKYRGASEDDADNSPDSRKKNKWNNRKRKQLMKVGHGGTLDPLASGVLVLGIGKGTTQLQSYLEGDKQYIATCELGYETDTLDCEGELVKTAPWEHIQDIGTVESAILPKFIGKIEQIPPMYSAIRIDGQRLYEIARGGDSTKAEAVEIPKREVEIYGLQVGNVLEESAIKSGIVDGPRYREQVKAREEEDAVDTAAPTVNNGDDDYEDLVADSNEKGVKGKEEDANGGGKGKKRRRRDHDKKNITKKSIFNEENVPSIQLRDDSGTLTLQLPQFKINVQCGGGTYIRSLVRDIGYELNTVATMTGLVRMKQGPFVLADALTKENWTADRIYEAIREANEKMK